MNELNYTRAIYLLNLWVTPDLLKSPELLNEATSIIKRLEHRNPDFTKHELFILNELIGGLSEAIISSIHKSDLAVHSVLLECIKDLSLLRSTISDTSVLH